MAQQSLRLDSFKPILNDSRVRALLPWAFPVLLIILWQILSATGVIPARVLPSPLSVLTISTRASKNRSIFPQNTQV
ncbi:binding-protein-dependent transport systems inner membrane component [Leptolyngbya sp. NIES-3755]|nr:binding-protein-dependent transport systems inner membrane component [Leptolyngbya sp. NIES-3755]